MKDFKEDLARIKRRMEDDSAYDQHKNSWRQRRKLPSSTATVWGIQHNGGVMISDEQMSDPKFQQAMLASGDVTI